MGSNHDLKRFLKSIFLQMLSERDLKPPKSICKKPFLQTHISSNEQWTWLETLTIEKRNILKYFINIILASSFVYFPGKHDKKLRTDK